MGWINVIMQYAIYGALVLCTGGLVAAIALFIALERRWQQPIAVGFEEVSPYIQQAYKADNLPIHPWEEMRNRIGEMQIVADEDDRPRPYKNVA